MILHQRHHKRHRGSSRKTSLVIITKRLHNAHNTVKQPLMVVCDTLGQTGGTRRVDDQSPIFIVFTVSAFLKIPFAACRFPKLFHPRSVNTAHRITILTDIVHPVLRVLRDQRHIRRTCHHNADLRRHILHPPVHTDQNRPPVDPAYRTGLGLRAELCRNPSAQFAELTIGGAPRPIHIHDRCPVWVLTHDMLKPVQKICGKIHLSCPPLYDS